MAGKSSAGKFTAGIFYIQWLVPGVLLAGLIYGALKGFGVCAADPDPNNTDHRTGAALALGSVAMLFVVALLWVSNNTAGTPGRRQLGWAAVLMGADGRVSTSKTQVLLWTFGLAYAASFLAGIAGLLRVPVFETADNSNWTDYLILLGGPFAAAVIAKAAVVTKFANGTMAKDLDPQMADPGAVGIKVAPLEPDPGKPANQRVAAGSTTMPKGLFTNDSGNADVIDTQYIVFNFVAFLFSTIVFLAQNFDSSISGGAKYALPQIPAILLGLTSAAAATYVGNKAIQRSGPRISHIAPSPAPPNSKVTVSGVNLVPPGTAPIVAKSQTIVQLTSPDGIVQAIEPEAATAVAVTFTLPADVSGNTRVAVVTTTGAATDSTPLLIRTAAHHIADQ